jgi:elongation factor Ts
LLGQVFVMDGKAKVAEVVARTAKELGAPVAIKAFVRYQLGEGIEKETSDFAAEVAAAMGN